MSLKVIKDGPEPWDWVRGPVVARREDVERVAALTRQAVALLREAQVINIGGRMTLSEEETLQEVEGDLAYLERCLGQPRDFIVVGFEVEEDDPESPAILERQRQRNTAIGAGDFTATGDLGYVLGAD
jgi:hypothetical protein